MENIEGGGAMLSKFNSFSDIRNANKCIYKRYEK